MDNLNINSQNNVLTDNFLNLIQSNILILKQKKKVLLQYILKISDYPSTNLSVNSSNQFIEFLSFIKEKILLIDENLSKAYDYLNKIKNSNTIGDFKTLFEEYTNISSNISNCIIDIENFFISSMNFISLDFDAQSPNKFNDEQILDLNNNNENDINEINSQISDPQDNNLIENTLVISETQGKIILPYTIDNLNLILKENDKYQNIDEVIENEFVIPYTNFKNPIFSRFKEAFKLIRYKEHGSIKDAFDLGMELLLNYNLHPAIISACKSIDELDIYLDYLENNETDKFDCFEIKFEIPPVIHK